jgi:hypothetical protein
MRHVRDVIRLKSAGMPTREIARRMGTAPSTVRLTIRRFEAAGLTWPLSDDITDTELEARLFARAGAGPGTRRGQRRLAEPDWTAVHRELKRKHVTLSILWEEYIAGEPGGYRYSRFCELYRAWEGRLSVTTRQSHAAGDKLFVDYAGDGVPVVTRAARGKTEMVWSAVSVDKRQIQIDHSKEKVVSPARLSPFTAVNIVHTAIPCRIRRSKAAGFASFSDGFYEVVD